MMSTVLSTMLKVTKLHRFQKKLCILIITVAWFTIILSFTFQGFARPSFSGYVYKDKRDEEIAQEIWGEHYLINTSQCRIPEIDPFGDDIIEYIRNEKQKPCTELGLLTYIDKSDGNVSLRINSSLLPQYSTWEVQCCYSNITRIREEKI
ncbi:hypothetical protein JTB14_009730 [Gonioctena quinquepunctata]|nr:hypothetical protein JTB14_009730 [Gonioctena quinquepunctata]